MNLAIRRYTATTALGPGLDELWRGLHSGTSGLAPCDFEGADLDTWIGAVPGLDTVTLPTALAHWDCRNNRLAELGLAQDGFREAVAELMAAHPPERIGLFLGTSTSGIGTTEEAYRQAGGNGLPDWFRYENTQDYYSVCGYVRQRLGLKGPAMAISTACSSSAKVFASATRFIDAGYCDAAIVGGVDSLCLTTLYGFHSLQLVSSRPCRPCDVDRDGISLGEAAGFAIVTPDNGAEENLLVSGWGESSDAHHMSSPDPEGRGAELAMRQALEMAGSGAVDAINLHGTGTPSNDVSECRAVQRVFGTATPVASTKGWTGHTLGAAGIVEAVICALCIEHGFLPRSLNVETQDPDIGVNVLTAGRDGPVKRMLSNSFGFGGSNCALMLERAV